MVSSNRNSLDQSQRTPYALSLETLTTPGVVTTVDRPAVRLGEVASLIGLAQHPLVGEKYPGLVPDPPTWPANKEIAAQAESWKLHIPADYSSVGWPRPIVVVINQSGNPYTNIEANLLPAATTARGWFLLSLKCVTDITFGSEISRLSVDAALAWATRNYNIDQRRIYFVGSSRGGGILSSHACVRQGPQSFTPAAQVLFSPLLEARQYWAKLPPTSGTSFGATDNNIQTRAHSERPDNAAGAWGDSPAVDHRFRTAMPLFYEVGSYAEFPSLSGDPGAVVDITRSIGANLKQVPTWLVYDPLDAVVIIPPQSQKLYAYLMSLHGVAATIFTETTVGAAGHGFGLLDVSGGVTSEAVLDYLEGNTLLLYPMPLEICASDDVPYSITRPFRVDVNDTARYTVDYYLGEMGYALTNVTRLARLDFDVSHDDVMDGFIASVGTPFVVTADAGCVVRLLGLGFTPTVVTAVTGVLSGGAGVGYKCGVDGANSVEVVNSGSGPMEFSVY